jgi:ferredoxin-NADP reductase
MIEPAPFRVVEKRQETRDTWTLRVRRDGGSQLGRF